ncbi:hypothetical protein FRC07_007590 [Ceratobasidium sp. 392]|nr:hypothetical protein FRC07_007590 [Ceratobasidium sp. 392]
MLFSSYIAGLYTYDFTEAQALNGLAVASTGLSFYCSWPGSDFKAKVEREAGKPVTMSPTFTRKAQAITGIHALGLFVPALTFLIAVPANRFVTPTWLTRTALPPVPSLEVYYGTRIVGCVGAVSLGVAMIRAFKALGSQWNYLGVRERPKLVKAGPYSVVRHPMYSLAMLEEVFMAMMFWNWIPLAALGGILIPAFAAKMPMEEDAILKSKDIGDEYRKYKKEVPWRVFPYIW